VPPPSKEFPLWLKDRGQYQDGAVMRIHFTVADSTRLRVVVLGPLAELQHSLTRLQLPSNQALYDSWRRPALAGTRALSPDVREVARFVAPPAGPMVDMFTLVGAADDHTEGLDRLCGSPGGPLRDEFAVTPTIAGIQSGWIGDFADGDRTARQRLTGALADYHDMAIGPYWPRIRAVLDKERAARIDVMATHGLDAMLTGLAPALHWKAPVLEVPDQARPGQAGRIRTITDIHLRGRGLLLAPSLFCTDPGLFTPWNDDPALLIYPIDLDALTARRVWRRTGEPDQRALAGLLGTTRAAALRVIADGCTTSELARQLGISPGGASQHATVLREAGLVISRRHRNTVRHTLTGLGVDLLNAT
jgi:DNA-binding transcriptional ArsR family regulator